MCDFAQFDFIRGDVQNLRAGVDGVRNHHGDLVNQLNQIQKNVHQLQNQPAQTTHGVQAAVVSQVKPAKPDVFTGVRRANVEEWLFSFEQCIRERE